MNKRLFFLMSTLIAIGIVFTLSLPIFETLKYGYSSIYFFKKQLIAGAGGLFFAWLLSFVGNQKWISRICFATLIITAILIVTMPFMPQSMVTKVNGAYRWIRLSGFSLSPIEFFKIGFIYFFAWSFTRKITYQKPTMSDEFKTLVPYLLLLFFASFIVAMLQNDIGQVMILVIVFMLMLLLAGTTFKFIVLGMLFALTILGGFIVTSPHRIRRVESWWSGSQDVILSFFPSNVADKLRVDDVEAPYQVGHSINAINNGGFFGQGLGEGMFKLGFLSEVHTDFVLSGMIEEIGIVGIGAVLFIFFLFLYQIFSIADMLKEKNRVYYLFSAGIGLMFLFSFLMNGFGVTSIIPIKGIAVPFLSYGGTHILASCFAVGLILSMSKQKKSEP